MSDPPVVLYRYDGSPFATKISDVLLLKGVPHKTVDVSMILPRPQITELLGINYRKIPILAIGNDVYCDTSLIALALERRFPAKLGYGTLFPPKKGSSATEIGLQKVFTVFYTDRPLFGLTSSTIPFDTFPDAFIKDRSSFSGRQIDRKAMLARQPSVLSALSTHLSLAEQQLSDGREFYLDTVSPSYTDIAVYFNFSWITKMKGMDQVLDPKEFPNFMKWFNRIKEFLSKRSSSGIVKVEKIDGQKAAELITGAASEPDVVGFDNKQAQFLGVSKGDLVSVTPEDTGASHPTTGKLLALNREEVVVGVKGKFGSVKVHLPRLAFTVVPASKAKL